MSSRQILLSPSQFQQPFGHGRHCVFFDFPFPVVTKPYLSSHHTHELTSSLQPPHLSTRQGLHWPFVSPYLALQVLHFDVLPDRHWSQFLTLHLTQRCLP